MQTETQYQELARNLGEHEVAEIHGRQSLLFPQSSLVVLAICGTHGTESYDLVREGVTSIGRISPSFAVNLYVKAWGATFFARSRKVT